MVSKTEIENWRQNWKTKKTERLSIIGINNIDDIIQESVKRSYAPSVQNTCLKQGKYGSEKLKVPRQECEPILSAALSYIYDKKNITEKQFINWETNLAQEIRAIYHKNGINLYTYGNSQKWINMAIKYLYSSDHINHTHKLFEVCYLPIDRIVQDQAYKEFGIKRLPVAWSKCDNWQDILDYEENIKNAINRQIGYTSRLWWECKAWQNPNLTL